MSSANTEMIDVSDLFKTSCRMFLKPGQLRHSTWFNLRMSMGAIQIMDPKVDSCTQNKHKQPSLVDSIRQGNLFLGAFSDQSELIGIMDELLACTVNWLCGDSLMQTIFICSYMHCTQLINDPFLRLFCEMLRSSIVILTSLLDPLKILYEEDQCPASSGIPLAGPDPIFDSLRETIPQFHNAPDAESLARLTVSQMTEETKQLIDDKLSNRSDHPTHISTALIDRMRFMSNFVQLVDKLHTCFSQQFEIHQDDLDDYLPVNPPNNNVENSDSVNVENGCNSLRTLISTILPFLTTLKELSRRLTDSSHLGKPCNLQERDLKAGNYGLTGFQPLLNIALLPPFMPHCVVMVERDCALTYLSEMFHEACQIVEWSASIDPANIPLHYLWTYFQRIGQRGCADRSKLSPLHSRTVTSCIFVRRLTSILAAFMVNIGQFMPSHLTRSPKDAFISSWLQFEPNSYHNVLLECIKTDELVGEYVNGLADYLSQFPHIYSLNRSRQRDSLHEMLSKLPDLITESSQAEWVMGCRLAAKDPSLPSVIYPNSSKPVVRLYLVTYLSLFYYQLAWDFVASGFQLDLYTLDELAPVYCFLVQMTLSLIKVKSLLTHPPPLPQGSESNASNGGSIVSQRRGTGQRKSRKKSNVKCDPVDSMATTTADKSEAISQLQYVNGWSSNAANYEVEYLSCHNRLLLGTLYALQAIDNCSLNNKQTLTRTCQHRLGLFLTNRNSPFYNWHVNFLTASLANNRPWWLPSTSSTPSQLMTIAANQFTLARQHAQAASAAYFTFGAPPDPLDQLAQLAGRNAVACRLLATNPERGPPDMDFDVLASRAYPELRLARVTEQSFSSS